MFLWMGHHPLRHVSGWECGRAVVQPCEAVDPLQPDRPRRLILRSSASEAAESHGSTKTAAFFDMTMHVDQQKASASQSKQRVNMPALAQWLN